MNITQADLFVAVPRDYPGWRDLVETGLPGWVADKCTREGLEALEPPTYRGSIPCRTDSPSGEVLGDVIMLRFTFPAAEL